MDEIRGRDGNGGHNFRERSGRKYVKANLQNGFEGMNFEQQRGSYITEKGRRKSDRTKSEPNEAGDDS